MTRTRYIVTFPAARPGDEVTWPNTVKVYADADAQVPLQSGQSVDESLTFSGWSDAASVVFSRPAGDNDTITVTSGSPSGTGAAAQTTGGSLPVPQAGDAGKLLTVTQSEDGFEISGPSRIAAGQVAFLANFTDLSVAIAAGDLHTVVDADVNAADSTLDPPSGNAYDAASDGNFTLTPGTYFIQVYGNFDYVAAPSGADEAMIGPRFTISGSSKLLILDSSNVATGAPVVSESDRWEGVQLPGDGASTSLSGSIKMVVIVLGGDITMQAWASGGNEQPSTLTEVQVYIVHAA